MTAAAPRALHAMVVAILAGGISLIAMLLIGPPAAADGAGTHTSSSPTTTETTTILTAEAPHASVNHDAGSGGWTFVVEGNKHVVSVRISVAENDCASGGETLWETKVTEDELRDGPATREVAFEGGTYCEQLLLDGVNKAEASITTTVPAPGDAEPEPTGSPEPTETPAPTRSAEYDRCSDDPEVDHRVLAGATGPDPDAPFIYQAFYPNTLQVRQGDLVEWCFNGGYDWHTVTFSAVDMDVAQHPEPSEVAAPRWWRWDEAGPKAFHEDLLFGHEQGDESKQCGRGTYWYLEPQPHCSVSTTNEEISSSAWDRFFSMGRPGTFRSTIDLEPGLYRYHCKLHASMHGYIEVLPEDEVPVNPTPAEIDEEIRTHYLAATAVVEELSDPSTAYDFEERRWTVHVGGVTPDRSVSIEQFMPSRIDARKGDDVHFIAGTDEPNTVTFPGGRQVQAQVGDETISLQDSDLQGGFSQDGRCGPHGCPTGRGAPWGMTGLAFAWTCDADAKDSGSPVPLPYVPAATVNRTNVNRSDEERIRHGCVAGGLPELTLLPWYSDEQRAPRDLVVSEKTFHNSGTILDRSLPEQVRTFASDGVRPGGTFPDGFDAKFPTAGTFKYFCTAHEFMKGTVVVR